MNLILAGNHKQAYRFAVSNAWLARDWRYINAPKDAEGYHSYKLYYTGTWREKRYPYAMLRHLRFRATETHYEPRNPS